MQYTVYTSSDGSAPVLTGETGKLNALLKAVLVDGYGSKAAAGWTMPFNTGTAVCVFKNGTGSTASYYRVRDDGPNVTSTFKEAWVRGYLVKADVNDVLDGLNTGQFPTAAQLTNGAVIRKSAAADSTARTWTIYANSRCAILLIYSGDSAGIALIHYFGDFYDVANLATRACVACRNTENSATLTLGLASFSTAAIYLAQSYTGAGTGTAAGVGPITTFNQQIAHGTDNRPFPNAPNGGRYLSRLGVSDSGDFRGNTAQYRGNMSGVWYPTAGQAVYADGNTISGTGSLGAYSWTLHKVGNGVFAIETSDTLEVN